MRLDLVLQSWLERSLESTYFDLLIGAGNPLFSRKLLSNSGRICSLDKRKKLLKYESLVISFRVVHRLESDTLVTGGCCFCPRYSLNCQMNGSFCGLGWHSRKSSPQWNETFLDSSFDEILLANQRTGKVFRLVLAGTIPILSLCRSQGIGGLM